MTTYIEEAAKATRALCDIAETLGRVEELLRPLPDEVAEANVRGIRGNLSPSGLSVFVLPTMPGDDDAPLDTRLLRVGIVDQVEQWLDAKDEVDADLVDRIERLVREWVAEVNA